MMWFIVINAIITVIFECSWSTASSGKKLADTFIIFTVCCVNSLFEMTAMFMEDKTTMCENETSFLDCMLNIWGNILE